MEAKQEYSETVLSFYHGFTMGLNVDGLLTTFVDWPGLKPALPADAPWERARVTFTWFATHPPDQANVLGNCKALLDILCMAPKSTQRNDTTYLGLIEDDKGVEAIGRVERVLHRADELVLVEIERILA